MSQTFAQLINGKSATVEFSVGSASTPAVSFSGDTNTGIYSPGADQVAISTNGTGRLFVNSSGNIGIGAANTGAATFEIAGSLQVRGSQTIENSSNTYRLLRIADIGSRDVRFDTWNGTDFNGTIRTGAQTLLFETGTGASLTEKMRLDSSGKLGLGTSSVTNSANLDIQLDTVPATDTYAKLQLRSGNYGYILKGGLKQGVGGQLHFDLNNNGSVSTQMVLDTGGRLGIGTTSPGNKLHVKNGSADDYVRIEHESNDTQLRIQVSSSASRVGLSATYNSTGSYYPLAFLTSDTERARIDTSGRLLVGTFSAPTAAVVSSATFVVQGYVGVPTGDSLISLQRGQAPASISSGAQLGAISFGANDGSPYAQIHAATDGTGGSSDYPGRLVFSTTADGASSPTERMRIKETGHTKFSNTGSYRFVGTGNHEFVNSLNTVGLDVYNTNASLTSTVLQISADRNTTNGTYNLIQASRIGNADVLRVLDSGNVQNANNSYGAFSDIKLKENVVDATSQWNDLKALQVRKYNFKEETGNSTHTQIGLIAQEAELVSPGLVSETVDRDEEGNDLGTVTKSLNYSVLYMKAVKALQEAMERIEQLETEMAEVKAQLQAS